MKKKIVFTVLYILFMAFTLELAARFAFRTDAFMKLIRKGEYPASAKWRHEWLKNRRTKKNAELDFQMAVHNELLGWNLKPNFSRDDEININSQGIRATQDFSYERNSKPRILILGESFTYGIGVYDHETYPGILQKLLPNHEILNFAVFGYGYDQMLLRFQNEGYKYKSDIVIIPYLAIDRKRSLISFRDYAKPYFKLVDDQLILKNTPIPPPKSMVSQEIFKSKLWDIFTLIKRNIDIKRGYYQKEEEAITNTILHKLVEEIRASGAIPLIAYIEGIRDNVPKQAMDETDKAFTQYWIKQKVYPMYLMAYKNQVDRKLLKEMMMDKNVKSFVFQRKYGHFSPRENAIIAVGIKDQLMKLNLIK